MGLIEDRIRRPRNFEYLITGSGRSGTEYMAHLLNHNGVDCGHECHYGLKFGYHTSESSWMAVPFVYKHFNSHIVKLFRHPISVIKSNLDLGYSFTERDSEWVGEYSIGKIPHVINGGEHIVDNEYNDYYEKYVNSAIEYHPESTITNIALQYLYWNQMFDRIMEDRFYEAIDFDALIRKDVVVFHGREWSVPKVVVNSKSNEKKYDIPIDVITGELDRTNIHQTLREYYIKMLNHNK